MALGHIYVQKLSHRFRSKIGYNINLLEEPTIDRKLVALASWTNRHERCSGGVERSGDGRKKFRVHLPALGRLDLSGIESIQKISAETEIR